MVKIVVFSLFFWICSSVFSASENGKFTVAFWGDSRSNSGNAFSEISGHLIRERGKTIDVHWQNGDFTSKGGASDWATAWKFDNVREACVKDYFYMCTSNHDSDRDQYQANMADILPSNGTNVYYYYKSWPVPGSQRRVHLLSWDGYFSDVTTQINYFKDKLKDVNPDDWIMSLWHCPSFPYMTYKYHEIEGFHKLADFMEYLAPVGGDMVFNGHAHVYVRTHVIAANGDLAETTGGTNTSHTSADTTKGFVHVVNGRGGVFGVRENDNNWGKNAFDPGLDNSEQIGLITFLQFDDNTIYLNTVRIGDDYDIIDTLDNWTWTRGPSMKLSNDSIAPVVTVNVLHTADNTPQLSGTIDDPTATITVDVASQQYTATNNGDGTWVLPDNTINPLGSETYDVTVTAVDTAGNIGTDISTDELSGIEDGKLPGSASLASGAIPVYSDGNGGIRINVPFDVAYSIDILDLQGKNAASFSGTRRGERHWNNPEKVSGVFYVVLHMAGTNFSRKILLMN
ncbi:MAG: hypothetical protein HQK83_20475 [Fibrobacteria bacterium]|nr:hypothetical protein [Fibrobacteria bacterium]